MARTLQSGTRVVITQGMDEFIGKIGKIEYLEMPNYYRIGFEEPVEVKGLGKVHDDIWEREGFKVLI